MLIKLVGLYLYVCSVGVVVGTMLHSDRHLEGGEYESQTKVTRS